MRARAHLLADVDLDAPMLVNHAYQQEETSLLTAALPRGSEVP